MAFSKDTQPLDKREEVTYPIPFGGIDTEHPGRTARPGMAASMSNCWLKDGFLSKIRSSAPWGTGMGGTSYAILDIAVFHRRSGNHQLVAIVNQGGDLVPRVGLWYQSTIGENEAWTEYATSDVATYGIASAKMVQAGERIFIACGDTVRVWDGSELYDAYQAPPAALTMNATPEVAAATGWLFAGSKYKFAVSFYSPSTGDETALSTYLEYTFVGSAGANRVRVDHGATVPHARFTHVRYYRTDADDVTLRFERVAAYTPSETAKQLGTIEDANLGVSSSSDSDVPPATATALNVWDGRMWYYGSADGKVRFSRPGIYNSVPTLNELSAIIVSGDGDDVTDSLDLNGRFFLFKSRRAYQITPGSLVTYEAHRIPASFGACHRNCVVDAQGSGYVLGDGILWGFDGFRGAVKSGDYRSLVRRYLGLPPDDSLYAQPALLYDRDPGRDFIILSTSGLYAINSSAPTVISLDGQNFGTFGVDKDGPFKVVPRDGVLHVVGGRSGRVRVFFRDEDDEVIAGTEVMTYDMKPIDVDPTSRVKKFMRLEFLTEEPEDGEDGEIEVTVSYNDGESTDALYTIPAYGSGYGATKLDIIDLTVPKPKETIGIKIVMQSGVYRKILSARIVFKPVGDLR